MAWKKTKQHEIMPGYIIAIGRKSRVAYTLEN